MDIDSLLPDEIQQHLEAEEESRLEDFDRLCNAIAEKRSEAVSGRLASGIETTWMSAEEAYLGVDDYNRHEFAGAKWAKPTSMDGPLTSAAKDGDGSRSTVFVPLTSRYVDAGYAKLCEILLPLDDKAFSFDPTPIPDLVKRQDDLTPVVHPETGVPLPKEMLGMPKPMANAPAENPQAPMTVKDLIAKEMEKAQEAADKAERRIYDWMVEAKHHAEMRKVIHDMARIGVGVLKGPFPEIRMSKAAVQRDEGIALEIIEQIKPGEKWVDPWNLFPDPSCGENIQLGDYLLERDFISPRTLKRLAKQPGYLGKQIKKVLKEGPAKCNVEGRNPNDKVSKRSFEIWYYYGTLTRKDMELAEAPGLGDLPEDCEDIYAIVTMVNDTIIRATINPLESGDFPYHAVPWRRRAGHWAGVGVGEQITVPQRMVNGATRAMMNNGGKSAGSQIVIDQNAILPADGKWVITPDKIWYKSPDAIADDVRKAFATFQTPNVTPQMMSIIEYAFRLAEEATSIPLVTQGQTGPTTPETYGAAQLQNNNAMSLLRSIAYVVDDHLTEPLVNQYYEWLLLDPTVPEDEKGDFKINAHGSISLVERAMQDQTMAQALGMAVNPAFGVDPKKVFREFLKSKRIDPRMVEYTEEEMTQMQEQAKQQAPAPAVQVAQIRADVDLKKEAMRNQAAVQKMQIDTDRDRAYVEAEIRRDHINATMRKEELLLKREIAYLEAQMRKGINLDTNKVKLAETSAKLRLQKELALTTMSRQVATPAIEPPGRAPNGQAFQR